MDKQAFLFFRFQHRFALQALFLLPVAIHFDLLRWPNRAEAGLHLLRGSLILIATSFFFAALKHMPIADAISIFLSSIYFDTAGGLFLGEPVGWRKIIACMVGFGGALLVIQPQYETVGLAAAFPVGTAICFAFYLLLDTQNDPNRSSHYHSNLHSMCSFLCDCAYIVYLRNSTSELHLILLMAISCFFSSAWHSSHYCAYVSHICFSKCSSVYTCPSAIFGNCSRHYFWTFNFWGFSE